MLELCKCETDWTQQQIADEVGCSKPYVNKVLTKNCDLKEKVNTPEPMKSDRDKADFRKLPHELQEQVRARHSRTPVRIRTSQG